MPDSRIPARVVLLVDEDLRTSRRLADMLMEDGFTVEVARDGAAAIARLATLPVPHALVTELNTGPADGSVVARFARTQRPHMPIIVVTTDPLQLQPSAFGGDPPLVLTKPIDYAKLREALASALHVSGAKAAAQAGG